MDSLTHILLGGAIAQFAFARRIGMGRAFWVGALAATLPDFDSFIRTGDAMRDHAMHRHFMHSLVMVPVLTAIAMLPFLFQAKGRALWKPLFLAGLLACTSHTLLDLLTSYGNMILWPFTTRRYALDIIAVVDPAVTLPLLIGVILAAARRRPKWAGITLAIAFAYFGIATLQHERAQRAQEQLLAARQVDAPVNPRVLPQIGSVLTFRSIYITDGHIQADAIRVPFLGTPTFKPGGTVPLATFQDLQTPLPKNAEHDFALFTELADGFVARSPADPLLISDQRYAFQPEGRESIWGIQLEQTPQTLFRITPRQNYFGRLLNDLFRPSGYASIETLSAIK